jgi:hypoxia up-regulated 1
VEKTTGAGTTLSKELYSEAKNRLESLNKKDTERRKTAELKNNLESYIYSMKENVPFFYYALLKLVKRVFVTEPPQK